MKFSDFIYFCCLVAVLALVAAGIGAINKGDDAQAVPPTRPLSGPPLRDTSDACFVGGDGTQFFFPRPCNVYGSAPKHKPIHFRIGGSRCTTTVAAAPDYFCSA